MDDLKLNVEESWTQLLSAQKQLEHYRNVMAEKHFELPDGVRPIMISKPNFELLLREGRSFEEYFRYEEEKTVAETEDAALKAPVADEEGEESSEGEEEPAEEPAQTEEIQ